MKNIIIVPGIRYFHDDSFTDDQIEICEFPYMRVFGDFRIFNGLPIEVVDEFVGRLKDVMVELKQNHIKYSKYWETHPNTARGTVNERHRG